MGCIALILDYSVHTLIVFVLFNLGESGIDPRLIRLDPVQLLERLVVEAEFQDAIVSVTGAEACDSLAKERRTTRMAEECVWTLVEPDDPALSILAKSPSSSDQPGIASYPHPSIVTIVGSCEVGVILGEYWIRFLDEKDAQGVPSVTLCKKRSFDLGVVKPNFGFSFVGKRSGILLAYKLDNCCPGSS